MVIATFNQHLGRSELLSDISINTVMCLSIGTPKIINFPFVPNGKINHF